MSGQILPRPGPAAVLRESVLQAALEGIPAVRARWGAIREIRVRALKAHRQRSTSEITVVSASGTHGLIGKAYARDRSDIFEAMQAFATAGFGPSAEWSIPEPIACVPSLGLRIEQRVEGRSAEQVLLQDPGGGGTDAARRCGLWLAEFHAKAPLRQGKPVGLEAERERWKAWSFDMADLGPPFDHKARALYQRLVEALPGVRSAAGCAAHGSYSPDHLILSGARSVAIDLDLYGVADPARDVGWFIISLQRLALERLGALRAMDGAVHEFRAAYLSRASQDVLERAGFYRAVECLRRGHRDLVSRKPPAREWAEMMLDEGLRA